jgi:hypothetical protein
MGAPTRIPVVDESPGRGADGLSEPPLEDRSPGQESTAPEGHQLSVTRSAAGRTRRPPPPAGRFRREETAPPPPPGTEPMMPKTLSVRGAATPSPNGFRWSRGRPHLGARSMALLPVLLGSCAPAAQDPSAADAVRDFYAAVRETGTTGAPSDAQLRSLAPFLGSELRDLLAKAGALRDAEAAAAPAEKPPFAEGDLFSSLFEGHTRMEILSSTPDARGELVEVRLTYERTPPPVSWTDRVVVRREAGRPVVVDVEYGGDWPFANHGTLRKWLLEALDAGPGAADSSP